jgi:hypothetical protein
VKWGEGERHVRLTLKDLLEITDKQKGPVNQGLCSWIAAIAVLP